MKITFYRGQGQGVTLATPMVVGLRPGYTYRVALSNMKKYPGKVYYPTLRVTGSVLLGGNLRACNFPAGVVFRDADFETANVGNVINKVVFLEKVSKAIPESSPPDNPFEIVVEPPNDPLAEARNRGLPVMTVRMGQRQEREAELSPRGFPAPFCFPATPIFPIRRELPASPGCAFRSTIRCLAPLPGYITASPTVATGAPAAFDAAGKLTGIDPADTVASFTRGGGKRQNPRRPIAFTCVFPVS